jgi:hypothetical protein
MWPELLLRVYDEKFVFGEYLGEAVGLFDLLRNLRRRLLRCVAERAGVQDIGSKAQLLRCFTSDGNLIARHHFDLDAHLDGVGDGFLGIRARRIEQGQHADKLPFALLIGFGHTQRTEAAAGKVKNGFLCCYLNFDSIGRHLENDLRSSLGYKELFPVRPLDGSFCAFVHRIEGHEVEYLAALQLLVVLYAAYYRQVDRVLVFGPGGQSGPQDNIPGRNSIYAKRIAQREFVLSQCAGLVGAENINACQFLNG